MANPRTNDANEMRTNWGGRLLAAGVLLFLVMVTLRLVLIPHAAFGEGTATNVVEFATAWQWIWWGFLAGGILVTAGAFFLVTRPLTGRVTLPASAFWLLFGVGGIFVVATNAMRLTGFVDAANEAAAQPALYTVFANGVEAFFVAGLLCIGIASLFILWGERRATNAAIPALLCYLGIVAVAARLVALGIGWNPGAEGAFLTARWLGYAGFYAHTFVFALLATRIAWPNALRMLAPQRRGTTTR